MKKKRNKKQDLCDGINLIDKTKVNQSFTVHNILFYTEKIILMICLETEVIREIMLTPLLISIFLCESIFQISIQVH